MNEITENTMRNQHGRNELEEHFAFGDNWAEYAKQVSPGDIEQAIAGLIQLLGCESLEGKRFLDIGSGSGIHSLAALRLGAAEVVAVDLDPKSVMTTQSVLEKFFGNSKWQVKQISVFHLETEELGLFDVVYSWGVLHHTGDMIRAIKSAASMVSPDGKFIFALYHKTWLCSWWKFEKRWYSKASSRVQQFAISIYVATKVMRLWIKGRSYRQFVHDYQSNRGMSYMHDVHDWLGGYPYESIRPGEVQKIMRQLGFMEVRSFMRNWFTARIGLFGTGCDEYVYQRVGIGARKH